MLGGCEYRVDEPAAAYLCVCGSLAEYGSEEAFRRQAKALEPAFAPGKEPLPGDTGTPAEYRLRVKNEAFLDYRRGNDNTQEIL